MVVSYYSFYNSSSHMCTDKFINFIFVLSSLRVYDFCPLPSRSLIQGCALGLERLGLESRDISRRGKVSSRFRKN